MSTPNTAAGRALLERLSPVTLPAAAFTTTTSAWKPWPPNYEADILAIEAEAAQAERERLTPERMAAVRLLRDAADTIDTIVTGATGATIKWGGDTTVARIHAFLKEKETP